MTCTALTTRRTPTAGVAWWAFAATGVAVGIAATSAWIVSFVVALMLVRAFATNPAIHRRLHERAQLRARAASRNRREARLEDACVARDELAELTEIVDRVGEVAPGDIERLELEQLLDRYVDLAVTRRTALERMARADRLGAYPHAWTASSDRRRVIDEERQSVRAACAGRIAELDDEIAQVADLIRLYGERATMPSVEYLLDDDSLVRRLELMEPA